MWIFGLPLSFGRRRTRDISHRKSGASFNSVIKIMIWCSDSILSLKSGDSFEYFVPSGLTRLWWCPSYRPDGKVIFFSPLFETLFVLFIWNDYVVGWLYYFSIAI